MLSVKIGFKVGEKTKKTSKEIGMNPALYKPVSSVIVFADGSSILDTRLENEKLKRELVPEDKLGHRLKQKREERNLTQEALSILTKVRLFDSEGKGISRPAIVNYEQGNTLPSAREIRILSAALDVTPSWLILGEYDIRKSEDKKGALLTALDDYIDNSIKERESSFLEQGVSTYEGVDPMLRGKIEMDARSEALFKNQEIHQSRKKTKPQ